MRSRSACWCSPASIAAATFRDYGLGWDDYTHSQYGDLLVSLYSSGFTDKRALSFVNLYMYGGGFDLARRARRQGSAVRPVRDTPARRRGGRHRRPVRHLAARPAPRRPARRSDRAHPPRRLPALLRPHVHQRQGRTVRGRPASIALLGIVRAFEEYPRATPGDRSRCAASASGLPSARASWAALRCSTRLLPLSVHCRRPIARERLKAGARANAARSSSHSFRRDPRLSGHGPGLAVERRRAAQSVSRRRIFFQFFRKAVARAVRRPVDPGSRHAAQLRADAARAASCRKCCWRSGSAEPPAPSSPLARGKPRRLSRTARRFLPSCSPRRCRFWSPSPRGRRCTTASAISSSCCRRLPCSAGLPARGSRDGLNALGHAAMTAGALVLVVAASPRRSSRWCGCIRTNTRTSTASPAARPARGRATCSTIGDCR